MTDPAHCLTCTCYQELPNPARNHKGKHHSVPQLTEDEAAAMAFIRSGKQRVQVLQCIEVATRASNGICDARGAEWSGIYHQAYLARRNELYNSGWVEDSGETEPTGNGGNGIKWRLSVAGRRKYPELGL